MCDKKEIALNLLGLATVILAIGISACSSTTIGRASIARQAETELIGKTKADIYRCASTPARSETVEGTEFLTYFSGGDAVVVGSGNTATVGQRSCRILFELVDGVVTDISYSGNTGGLATKGEQCGYLLRECIGE